MQVILLERIAKLGQLGDIVNVKDGFARNYLLPQGKALRANDANRARFETQRADIEARNLERKKEADGVHEKLDGTGYVLIRSAGETGQLYGSVSTRDIANALAEEGFTVARSQISLQHPIKVIGVHTVEIVLHPEVSSAIKVNVARSGDEATRQARGEDLTGRQTFADDEDEAEIDLEEIFENPDDAEDATADGDTVEAAPESDTGSDAAGDSGEADEEETGA